MIIIRIGFVVVLGLIVVGVALYNKYKKHQAQKIANAQNNPPQVDPALLHAHYLIDVANKTIGERDKQILQLQGEIARLQPKKHARSPIGIVGIKKRTQNNKG